MFSVIVRIVLFLRLDSLWCGPKLAAGLVSQSSWEGEIMRRRFSIGDVFARRLRCEALEDRLLLSVAVADDALSDDAIEMFHT